MQFFYWVKLIKQKVDPLPTPLEKSWFHPVNDFKNFRVLFFSHEICTELEDDVIFGFETELGGALGSINLLYCAVPSDVQRQENNQHQTNKQT